jgi:O-antigen ligase
MQGGSVAQVEYLTGVKRYVGVSKYIHPFSYGMFFISVYFYIRVNIYYLSNKLIKFGLIFLLCISVFCLLKTYTRTTTIGLVVFWLIAMWGYNKKYFIIGLFSLLISAALYFGAIHQFFFKTNEIDFDVATSGRTVVWEHNLSVFLESSFDRKLLGHGLGVQSSRSHGADFEIWPSHNDYIQVLMAFGGIGFLLYFFIFLVLLKDVYMFSIDKNIKYFYFGLILSIMLIDFGTGLTVNQVGSSQQFWMVMGLFYVFRNSNYVEGHSL